MRPLSSNPARAGSIVSWASVGSRMGSGRQGGVHVPLVAAHHDRASADEPTTRGSTPLAPTMLCSRGHRLLHAGSRDATRRELADLAPPRTLASSPCALVSSGHRGSGAEGAGVKLINTDGMAFIGPGSEWFWTALSGIVLAVTFLAIYRQLRLQRSQAAVEQVDAVMREFFSERMLGHQLVLLLAMQAGADRENLPEGSVTPVYNYFNKVGQLARDGHIDLKNIGGMAAVGLAWWATLEPHVRRHGARLGPSSVQDPFEWLAGRFAEIMGRAGMTIVFDDAYLRDSLERRIAITRDMLRVEQSLRTVIIASPEAAPTVPPTAPAVVDG